MEKRQKVRMDPRQEARLERSVEANLGACLERDLGTSVEEDMETGLDIRVVPQRGPSSSPWLGPQGHAGTEHANCAL